MLALSWASDSSELEEEDDSELVSVSKKKDDQDLSPDIIYKKSTTLEVGQNFCQRVFTAVLCQHQRNFFGK